MRNGTALVGFIVSAAVGFAVGWSAGRDASRPPEQVKAPAPKPAAEKNGAPIERVPLGASPRKGPEDAPVTIVEFSEPGCAFCARAGAVKRAIEEKHGREVRFVWKAAGRSTRPEIAFATEVLLAAEDHGKFWELHAKLARSTELDETSVREAARELGLDAEQLIVGGRGRERLAEDRALADALEVTDLPVYFVNGVRLGGLEPLPAFEAAIAAAKANAGESYEDSMRAARDRPRARPQREAPAQKPIALAPHAPIRGAKDPRVVLTVFSDFECADCARANATIEKLLEEHRDTLAVQFRHLPLSQHKRAHAAAKAAIAAHLQGEFWRYHDLLFANPAALGDADLLAHARKLGLDVDRFDRDRRLSSGEAVIARDLDDAARYGVRGTPTFFVNGVPIRGAQTYAYFAAVIDAELARAAGKAVEARPIAGNAPRRGPEGARVEVVVFSDFECAACAQLPPMLDRLLAEHPGEVAIAFKQYPLPIHRSAELASVAALAAHRHGKFWEMHDRLFAAPNALARKDLLEHARALGLDPADFDRALDDPALRAQVKADITEGVKLGITGTPALFVAGKRLEGLPAYEALAAAVQAGS
jgi:protein-disulfide isomerase